MAKAQDKDFQKFIEDKVRAQLKRDGIKMSKKISSGGFMTAATYDNRTVYTLRDLYKLNDEGFVTETNLGMWLFNAFMRTD